MSGYLPLTFIREKVRDLQHALFFSLSEDVLKIPACVVNILSIDELGQLWFVIPQPAQQLHAFERIFPVKLDFFRKGRDFYLKVLGKGFIVTDPEEINVTDCIPEEIKQNARRNQAMIIKVCMSHADYIEKKVPRLSPRQVFRQVRMALQHWFVESNRESRAVFHRIPVNQSFSSSTHFN